MKNKTRNNKRKPLLVVALVLMVALVLGMGAMTYSRYITTANTNSDKTTATVAKWGYVVTINANNMFGKEYKNGSIMTTKDENNDVRAVVDSSGNQALIIAPGTGGSMTITVNGNADVLAELSITVNDSQDVSLKENGAAYNPIKWTLTKNDAPVDDASGVTLETLVEKLESTETINAGDNIADTYTISWSWALTGQDDEADTVLGLKAAGKDEIIASEYQTYTEINTQLKLDISVTIQQIQNS